MPRKKELKTCKQCGELKMIREIFCSRRCYFDFRKLTKRREERDCRHCGELFEVNLKMIEAGWGKGIFCSKECYNAHPKSEEFKQKISALFRGSGHPNWKGGVMKGRKDRNLMEYKNWRKAVFERDHFTCQECGVKNEKGLGRTVKLEADHILPWGLYPQERYNVENGRTLCQDCHYLAKRETMDQYHWHRIIYST